MYLYHLYCVAKNKGSIKKEGNAFLSSVSGKHWYDRTCKSFIFFFPKHCGSVRDKMWVKFMRLNTMKTSWAIGHLSMNQLPVLWRDCLHHQAIHSTLTWLITQKDFTVRKSCLVSVCITDYGTIYSVGNTDNVQNLSYEINQWFPNVNSLGNFIQPCQHKKYYYAKDHA